MNTAARERRQTALIERVTETLARLAHSPTERARRKPPSGHASTASPTRPPPERAEALAPTPLAPARQAASKTRSVANAYRRMKAG